MADFDHTSFILESKPLNTTLEPTSPEIVETATPELGHQLPNQATGQTDNQATDQITDQPEALHGAEAPESHDLSGAASSPRMSEFDPEYDPDDFAAALESFDREQAAEKDAAQSLTSEETVVTGTVVKITDKHAVIDIGLKSEGLIPLDQVMDHTGTPKFAVGDTIEVVVEREESEGGYLVSYEKALRHKVWDKLEEAANTKIPVKGIVVSRVKGGITVDIGIRHSFLVRRWKFAPYAISTLTSVPRLTSASSS